MKLSLYTHEIATVILRNVIYLVQVITTINLLAIIKPKCQFSSDKKIFQVNDILLTRANYFTRNFYLTYYIIEKCNLGLDVDTAREHYACYFSSKFTFFLKHLHLRVPLAIFRITKDRQQYLFFYFFTVQEIQYCCVLCKSGQKKNNVCAQVFTKVKCDVGCVAVSIIHQSTIAFISFRI